MEDQVSEVVEVDPYQYLTDFTIDGYIQGVFAACIAIGAILPVGGMILAGIVRAARVAMGFDRS